MQTGQTNYIPLKTPLQCYYYNQDVEHMGKVVGLAPSYIVTDLKETSELSPKEFALKIDAPILGETVDLKVEPTQESHGQQQYMIAKVCQDSVATLNRLIARTRKEQHIDICQNQNIEASDRYTGFETLNFIPKSIPAVSWEQLDTRSTFLGYESALPLLITGMTGGLEQGAMINQRLAQAAQHFKIPMGVGSQRIALEHPEYEGIFNVKTHAPDVFLIANLGIGQLTDKERALEYARKSLAMIEADALAIHVNIVQELVQNEGDRSFEHILESITYIKNHLAAPVIIKEVGCGLDLKTAQELYDAGIQCLDVGGRGGTSWAFIESKRQQNALDQQTGAVFRDWGIPTAHALAALAQHFDKSAAAKPPTLVATGGIRDGLTVAKAVALGARMCGIGLPLFKAALHSQERVFEVLASYQKQLKIVMLATDSARLDQLKEHLTWDIPYKESIAERLATYKGPL